MEKTYDSVFDIANDADLEFDAIFDEDDELADTIEGVNEDGNSLIYEEDEFAELHQTDDDATPDDIRDELGPDHDEDFGNKDAEGTDKVDLDGDQEIKDLEKNGESDAEKELGLEKLDDEYQDGKADGNAPNDVKSVTDVVEKEIDESAEEADIDAELDPVSAPSDTADGEEHPVAAEIPSDTGEGEPTNECGNCPEITPEVEELIRKAEAAGFVVKKAECIEDIVAKLRELGFEVEPAQVPAPAEEVPAEAPAAPLEKCGEAVEDAEIVKSDDELAPEGDEEYNEDDTASVGEAGEVDIDDELDDELADEADSADGSASVDLDYDPSDEDIIDMVLKD